MGNLARAVSGVYDLRRKFNSEETYLRRKLRENAPRGARLLDVGCGFSRFYEIIRGEGLEYTGVDVNPDVVRHNRSLEREVYTETELPAAGGQFDVLLLSHVIEHFDFAPLVQFLNAYLCRLKEGGLVIIFTPLLHRGFFDDFDHVKPYNPAALRQLFCRSSAQTQQFGLVGRYVELDCWFKRDSLWHSHRAGNWTHLFSIPLTLAVVASRGLLGRLTGYGMVLKKVG